MKVIILAAGIGNRFDDKTVPKALLPLANGKTILGQQLEHISTYLSLDHVYVVVGYKKEEIEEMYSNLHFIENPDFATTNTAKSLLLALEAIEEDDVLWLNGDVVFQPSVLHVLLNFGETGMIVNEDKVEEEEVKYKTDGINRIVEVSKEVNPKEAKGEALGINLFKAADLSCLKEKLKSCANQDYFEKAVELCIEEGTEVYAVPVADTSCIEVDFTTDLEKANSYLLSWEK